ncbi:MAG: GC-type dockerin domain-anchored protein [Phycisphaerales bacterium JB054]
MIRAAICHSLPVLLLASAGLAQTQWNNAAGGAWNLAANWDPSDVPDMPDESASIDLAGTYTVVIGSIDPAILALSITNPNATLGINGAETLTIGAGLFNDGLIVVDYNNSSASSIVDFLNDLTIDGTGVISLNQTAERAQLVSSAGAVVTNGPSHTIDGRGRIRVAMVNDGLIHANRINTAIELLDADKTNNSLILASDGGFLDLVSVVVDQTGPGVIRADNGRVRVASGDASSINNGTIEGVNGGVVEVLGGAELLVRDATLNGSIDILGAGTMRSRGSVLTNNSLLRVDSNNSSSAAVLDFADPVTLDGSGVIDMIQIGDRSQITTSTGSTFTHGANHTIEGRGRIYASMINNGTIRANHLNTSLELLDAAKTNNSLMVASDGGFLDLVSVEVNQGAAGLVRADGSRVRVPANSVSTISNGTVDSLNGGAVVVTSSGVLTLHDITLDGNLDIEGNGTVRVTGSGLDSDALIRVDANNSSANAVLDFADPIVLNGNGSIEMIQIGDRSQITTSTGATFIHGTGHTIRGRGRIYASMVNNGTVTANTSNTSLEILGADKTNNSLMEARDNGRLELVDGTVIQGPSGVIRADGGTVLIAANNTPTVVNGSIEAVNGGIVEVTSSGVLTLENVQIQDTLNVEGSGLLVVQGTGTDNNGLTTINSNNSSAAASLVFLDSGTIGGTGEIALPSVGARSAITSDDGVVGTIGAGQRVTGRGAFDGELRMEGSIAPGTGGIGELQLLGDLAMQPAGVLEIEFNSLIQFDELTGPGTFSAGGTLAASNTSGGAFDPVFGDSFVVVAAAGGLSDRFDAVTGPALPGVLEWRVRYEPTQAVLIVSCDGDANLDGVINTLDVLGFLNLWTAGDPRADITGDGNVNTLDVLAFLNAWTAGC